MLCERDMSLLNVVRFLLLLHYDTEKQNQEREFPMKHKNSAALLFEPPRGKTNNVVSEQVQRKPGCTSTEKS